jgi:hypothetical protein
MIASKNMDVNTYLAILTFKKSIVIGFKLIFLDMFNIPFFILSTLYTGLFLFSENLNLLDADSIHPGMVGIAAIFVGLGTIVGRIFAAIKLKREDTALRIVNDREEEEVRTLKLKNDLLEIELSKQRAENIIKGYKSNPLTNNSEEEE